MEQLIFGAAEASAFEGVTFEALVPFYQFLVRFLTEGPQQRPAGAVQQPLVAAPHNELDFLAFDRIPLPLHDDHVFRRFLCPISGEPIRDPVRDQNGITLYERAAITRWLQVRQVSPVTRAPMHQRDLADAPEVRALIDHRLGFHRDRMYRVLADGLALPVVDVEHRAVLEQHPE